MPRKFKSKLLDYVKSSLDQIPAHKIKVSTYSYQNNRCHFNSVNAVECGRADAVILCIAWANDVDPIVHFINRVGGEYFDDTLPKCFGLKYSIIREIGPHEHHRIDDLLMGTKRNLWDMLASRLDKILFKINGDWMC